MVGRNNPCPCGSGKKYKRCCAGKSEVPIEELVSDELNRILLGVYENALDPADLAAFNSHRRHWVGKLGNLWDNKSIQRVVSEYFLFVMKEQLWTSHLVRTLNTPVRTTTRSIVEMWQSPIVLFGNVTSVENGFVEVQEILGDKTYFLTHENGMTVEKDFTVFGVVLADPRNHPNGVYVISTLMFVKDGNGSFRSEVSALAKSSGFENTNDFYKEHMADVYRILLGEEKASAEIEELIDERLAENQQETASILVEEKASTEELLDESLTKNQQEAITILEEKLEELGANTKSKEQLINIGEMYFLKTQPNFRKPSILSAAVLTVAVELDMVAFEMTNAEIAKQFDVSTSSVKNHADKIQEFVLQMSSEANQEAVLS
ncbi:SEC-C metal-binding domain-containing protein [Sporosarcina sp. G11-34]|uniref:SEC-C metal-binding domain-containing protein n=1 Tax=Sporosarcina sp. G11-34 TaxID=2849605 RepID=UPI0022A9E561|nr:SEC-C metal-binding domain-containing protein [Sporosarcina sp. G11-34]MCZ2257428.1 SEC-C domain-containing protein [Sporosarcina sp. G11-34]